MPSCLHAFTPSHLHTFTPSHLHTFTPLHLYTFTPLHLYLSTSLHLSTSLPLYISTSLHLYISTSLHRYIVTSLHRYIVTSLHRYIFTSSHLTSSHLHIFTSSHLHIFTSSHLHIFPSSHLPISTSSHLHISTSPHLYISTSLHHYIFTFLHLCIFTSTSTSTLQAVSCGTCDTVTPRGAVHNTDTCPRHLCTTCTTRTCVHGTRCERFAACVFLLQTVGFKTSPGREPRSRGHCGEDVHPQVKTGLFGATSGDRQRRLLRGDAHEVMRTLARRFRTGGRWWRGGSATGLHQRHLPGRGRLLDGDVAGASPFGSPACWSNVSHLHQVHVRDRVHVYRVVCLDVRRRQRHVSRWASEQLQGRGRSQWHKKSSSIGAVHLLFAVRIKTQRLFFFRLQGATPSSHSPKVLRYASGSVRPNSAERGGQYGWILRSSSGRPCLRTAGAVRQNVLTFRPCCRCRCHESVGAKTTDVPHKLCHLCRASELGCHFLGGLALYSRAPCRGSSWMAPLDAWVCLGEEALIVVLTMSTVLVSPVAGVMLWRALRDESKFNMRCELGVAPCRRKKNSLCVFTRTANSRWTAPMELDFLCHWDLPLPCNCSDTHLEMWRCPRPHVKAHDSAHVYSVSNVYLVQVRHIRSTRRGSEWRWACNVANQQSAPAWKMSLIKSCVCAPAIQLRRQHSLWWRDCVSASAHWSCCWSASSQIAHVFARHQKPPAVMVLMRRALINQRAMVMRSQAQQLILRLCRRVSLSSASRFWAHRHFPVDGRRYLSCASQGFEYRNEWTGVRRTPLRTPFAAWHRSTTYSVTCSLEIGGVRNRCVIRQYAAAWNKDAFSGTPGWVGVRVVFTSAHLEKRSAVIGDLM